MKIRKAKGLKMREWSLSTCYTFVSCSLSDLSRWTRSTTDRKTSRSRFIKSHSLDLFLVFVVCFFFGFGSMSCQSSNQKNRGDPTLIGQQSIPRDSSSRRPSMIVSFPVGRHDGALPQPTTGRLHSNRTISLFLGLTRLILRCFFFKDFIKD